MEFVDDCRGVQSTVASRGEQVARQTVQRLHSKETAWNTSSCCATQAFLSEIMCVVSRSFGSSDSRLVGCGRELTLGDRACDSCDARESVSRWPSAVLITNAAFVNLDRKIKLKLEN